MKIAITSKQIYLNAWNLFKERLFRGSLQLTLKSFKDDFREHSPDLFQADRCPCWKRNPEWAGRSPGMFMLASLCHGPQEHGLSDL